MKPGDSTLRLVDYLLGKLAESERNEIEERYLSDEAFHEELLALESELVDAGTRGELSAEERRHLTSQLNPEGAQHRLLFAQALNAWTESAGSAVDTEAPRRNIWAAIWEHQPHTRFAAAIAATLVLLLGVGLIFRQSYPRRATVQTRERQGLSSNVMPNPAIVLVLNPIQRSVGGQSVLVLPHQQRTVRLELALDGTADYSSYSALVKSADGSWSETIKGLTPLASVSGGWRLVVELSSTNFRIDDYSVTVSGVRSGSTATIAGYVFRAIAQ